LKSHLIFAARKYSSPHYGKFETALAEQNNQGVANVQLAMDGSQARPRSREVKGVGQFFKAGTVCIGAAYSNREYASDTVLLAIAYFLFGGLHRFVKTVWPKFTETGMAPMSEAQAPTGVARR
jgi:hypothetical protein